MINKLLFIIILFFIFLIIYNIRNREKFISVDNIKNIKDAKIKLNLGENNIPEEKGSPGIGGEKGQDGEIGYDGDDGAIGVQGPPGNNGKSYGELVFKKNGEEIDRLYNYHKGQTQQETIIEVPEGKQGMTGLLGPIQFINHKEEIIGEYYPSDEKAQLIDPIIVYVPKGIKGEVGDNGENTEHPKGVQGKEGEQGIPGYKGPLGLPAEKLLSEKGDEGGNANWCDDSDNAERQTGDDNFSRVTIEEQICFIDSQKCEGEEDTETIIEPSCINSELLDMLINRAYYIKLIKQRKNRILNQLCKLEYPNDYKLEKNPADTQLKVELGNRLIDIYLYLFYYDNIKEDGIDIKILYDDYDNSEQELEKIDSDRKAAYNKDIRITRIKENNTLMISLYPDYAEPGENIDDETPYYKVNREICPDKFHPPECGPGQYLLNNCSCENITPCGNNFYILEKATPTSDNVCTQCTVTLSTIDRSKQIIREANQCKSNGTADGTAETCAPGTRPNPNNTDCIINVCDCNEGGEAATGVECTTNGANICGTCDAGYYLHQGTKACLKCPYTHSCAGGTETQQPCPKGQTSRDSDGITCAEEAKEEQTLNLIINKNKEQKKLFANQVQTKLSEWSDWDDKIAGFKILPGSNISFYQNYNFKGKCFVISGGDAEAENKDSTRNFMEKTWKNSGISSFKNDYKDPECNILNSDIASAYLQGKYDGGFGWSWAGWQRAGILGGFGVI